MPNLVFAEELLASSPTNPKWESCGGVQREITLTVGDATDADAARKAGEAELVGRLGSQMTSGPAFISAFYR